MCSCFDGGTQMVDISAQVPVNADLSILCDLFVRIEPGDFSKFQLLWGEIACCRPLMAVRSLRWKLWRRWPADDQLGMAQRWGTNGPKTQAVMFQVAIVSTCFNMFRAIPSQLLRHLLRSLDSRGGAVHWHQGSQGAKLHRKLTCHLRISLIAWNCLVTYPWHKWLKSST